jgi:hypothetical protein
MNSGAPAMLCKSALFQKGLNCLMKTGASSPLTFTYPPLLSSAIGIGDFWIPHSAVNPDDKIPSPQRATSLMLHTCSARQHLLEFMVEAETLQSAPDAPLAR